MVRHQSVGRTPSKYRRGLSTIIRSITFTGTPASISLGMIARLIHRYPSGFSSRLGNPGELIRDSTTFQSWDSIMLGAKPSSSRSFR